MKSLVKCFLTEIPRNSWAMALDLKDRLPFIYICRARFLWYRRFCNKNVSEKHPFLSRTEKRTASEFRLNNITQFLFIISERLYIAHHFVDNAVVRTSSSYCWIIREIGKLNGWILHQEQFYKRRNWVLLAYLFYGRTGMFTFMLQWSAFEPKNCTSCHPCLKLESIFLLKDILKFLSVNFHPKWRNFQITQFCRVLTMVHARHLNSVTSLTSPL
jgi:hypothetical protein